MQFSPTNWRSVPANGVIVPEGSVSHIKLEAPGALHMVVDGVETLVGYGHEFKITGPTYPHTYKSKKASVIRVSNVAGIPPTGDVFTNDEKRPFESPAERAVKLALRRLNQKEREVRSLIEASKPQPTPEPDLPPEPEPKPEPEPTPEPDPEA